MYSHLKLSISVVSYNQKKYLELCIKSILDQKLPLHYEIIIGDDASTDDSQEYLKNMANMFPDIIKPILRKKNLGLAGNLFETTKQCQGELIAHIDADDLMHPNKLLSQINFLDSNPEYNIVFHKVDYIDEAGNYLGQQKNEFKDTTSLKELIIKNKISHSSKMYRHNSIKNYFFDLPYSNIVPDWYINLCNVENGKIKYLPELLGSYRILNSSASRKTKSYKLAQSKIEVLNTAYKNIKAIKLPLINKSKTMIFNQEASKNIKNRKYKRASLFLHYSLNTTISSKGLYLIIKLQILKFSHLIKGEK